jgi:hypothetical protein
MHIARRTTACAAYVIMPRTDIDYEARRARATSVEAVGDEHDVKG